MVSNLSTVQGPKRNGPVLTTPDMLDTSAAVPPLGKGFSIAMEEAQFTAGQEQEFICHMLHNVVEYPIQPAKDANFAYVSMIPGHFLGGSAYGPKPAEVMVIGKMPGIDENNNRRFFVGQSGQKLRDVLRSNGIAGGDWYASNVCRFMPPFGSTTLKREWVKDCAHFLHQEIKLVKPKFLLLLGADAVKAIFPKTTLSRVRGAFIEKDGMQVFATTNPSAVLRKPEMEPAFLDDMQMFTNAVNQGKTPNPQPTQYWYINTQFELNSAVDALIAAKQNTFAIDCEWAGKDYVTGTLRTIQISWATGHAFVVRLRDDDQKECFEPNRYAAVDALRRLLFREGVEIVGHNLRADLPWLVDFGLSDIVHYFVFDTMLVNHLLQENAQHSLTACVLRMTDMGRYDMPIEEWKLSNGLGDDGGYGTIPDRLLLKYGAQDADGTFRIAKVLKEILYRSENAELKDLYYNVVHKVTEAILEIEMTGLYTDPERMKSLAYKYADKRDELIMKIRSHIDDETFNFRSPKQVQILLFGKLKLTPIKTTKAHENKMWERYVSEGGSDIHAASTDKESLGILATQNQDVKAINMLRDLKFIDQITKSFLRLPENEESAFDTVEVYDKGLLSLIHPDQRIRPNISQLTTTGRWRCYRPNLQNIPKRRERDYDRIFSPTKVFKLRSCFTSRPGYVFVEADYVQAELFVLAWISQDANLLNVLTTPGRDLHSETAKTMFQLQCFIGMLNGAAVDEVKESHEGLRVAAKSVNFGIAYQRGAQAIAREVLQEGIKITVQEAQAGIDGFYCLYPNVRPYIDHCGMMAVDHGYIQSPYGRKRRFPKTTDDKQNSAYKREACNFPIQGTVADTLSIACVNTMNYRRGYRLNGEPLDFKLILAIHDAIVLEVRADHVAHVVNTMLPVCMNENALIPVLNQRLDIDTSIGLRWGEEATSKTDKGKKTIEELISMGVDESLF